jgi:hypothetical protein
MEVPIITHSQESEIDQETLDLPTLDALAHDSHNPRLPMMKM